MNNTIKRISGILLSLILFCSLLPMTGSADGDNTLILRKVINKGNRVIEFIDGKIVNHPNPDEIELGANAEFSIWLVGDDKTISELNSMSLEALGNPVAKKITDSQGFARFTGLKNGNYYIRETTKNGSDYTGIPILVKIPIVKDGVAQNPSYVYIKVVKPPNPDVPVVPTEPEYGRVFIKLDADSKKPLEGAWFKLVTKEKDDDGNYYYKDVLVDGKPYVVKSDINGKFEFKGLKKGTYYVVETRTPNTDGNKYYLLKDPIMVILDDDHNGLAPVVILNKKIPTTPTPPVPEKPTPPTPVTPPSPSRPTPPKPPIRIPKTGDIELLVLSAVGMSMVGVGMFVYKDKKGSKKQDK